MHLTTGAESSLPHRFLQLQQQDDDRDHDHDYLEEEGVMWAGEAGHQQQLLLLLLMAAKEKRK